MKNLFIYFLLAPFFLFSQQNAIAGINFGMSKAEIKKEFNSNKNTYKNINLGGYLWRLYYQNNTYDQSGGMTSIKLFPRGSALTGLPEHQSKLVFEGLIETLTNDGYSAKKTNIRSNNYFEFKADETYTLVNLKKKKVVFVGTPRSGANIYLNLVITKQEKQKTTSPF